MIPFLAEMKAIHDETESDPKWQNPEFDPPTLSWNIGINDHTQAINITAPQSICTVYFRAMPGMDVGELMDRARAKAEECGLEFQATVETPPLYVDPQSEFIRDVLQLAGRETVVHRVLRHRRQQLSGDEKPRRLRSRRHRPGPHQR